MFKQFKYLGMVLSKHGEGYGELLRAVKGRRVIGSLAMVITGIALCLWSKGSSCNNETVIHI